MREAFDRITELEQKRKTVPTRVPVAVATGKDVLSSSRNVSSSPISSKWSLIRLKVTLCISFRRITGALQMRDAR
jgi:hypothetical protein